VPALLDLSLLYITLGLAILATIIVTALFEFLIKALKAIGLGGTVTDWLASIEQGITSALGTAEHKIDAAIGWQWHKLAESMQWAWREIKGHADTLLAIAAWIPFLSYAVAAVRALAHRTAHQNAAVAPRVKTLEREYRGIEHKLKQIERDISKGIGADVLPRIKTLEREVATVEGQTIPAIRSAEAADSLSIGNLWHWVKRNVAVPGTAVFTGAVAVALGALGLGWLRCNSNPFNNNKKACGLWGDFAALMGLATFVLAATDLELLAKEMQAVEHEVTVVIADLVGVGQKLGL
jgi:hypothetical protein